MRTAAADAWQKHFVNGLMPQTLKKCQWCKWEKEAIPEIYRFYFEHHDNVNEHGQAPHRGWRRRAIIAGLRENKRKLRSSFSRGPRKWAGQQMLGRNIFVGMDPSKPYRCKYVLAWGSTCVLTIGFSWTNDVEDIMVRIWKPSRFCWWRNDSCMKTCELGTDSWAKLMVRKWERAAITCGRLSSRRAKPLVKNLWSQKRFTNEKLWFGNRWYLEDHHS